MNAKRFSKEERLLLRLLAKSASNVEIAEKMGWKKSVVTKKLKKLYERHEFNSSTPRAQAGCFAVSKRI